MSILSLLLIFMFLPTMVHADTATGLVGWWRFDEANAGTCSGGYITDSSSTGNTGTCAGSPSWVSGHIGRGAMSFNGTSSYVVTNSALAVSGGSARTYALWFKATTVNSPEQGILTTGKDSALEAFGLFLGSLANGQIYFYSNTLDWNTGAGAVSAGVWNHIVITYNGGAIQTGGDLLIYINGASVSISSRGTGSGTLNTTSNPFYIGAYNTGPAEFFGGLIDDVRIYNRALSASDVAELYAVTQPYVVRLNNARINHAKLGY